MAHWIATEVTACESVLKMCFAIKLHRVNILEKGAQIINLECSKKYN